MPTAGGNSDTVLHPDNVEDHGEPVARVLLVASDAKRLDACARTLEAAGIPTTTARTGFEAIVKACWHLPEVIVMQERLMMADEGVDGTVAAQMIRVCPATAHIPIVDAASLESLQSCGILSRESLLLADVARQLAEA
jgi:CheY-like chemotaxis protein